MLGRAARLADEEASQWSDQEVVRMNDPAAWRIDPAETAFASESDQASALRRAVGRPGRAREAHQAARRELDRLGTPRTYMVATQVGTELPT
jgi:hypothetical protein